MAKIIAVPAGFSAHLKITFLCLCLLVITTCKENYVNRSLATGCPLWHIRNKNGQCECGADYYQTVKCDKSYVYIQHGNCITWNNSTNSAVLYTCLYSTLWDTTQDTYRIPNNVSGTELNEITCKDYNRKGEHCRECIDGYGPAVFSDGITCTECSKRRYLWILNLLFQIIMVCLMYLLFALFQINLMSSPLNLIVLFLQFVVQEMKSNSIVHFKGVQYIGHVPIKILFTLFAVLNLDFFHMILPPLCITTSMKAVNILLFDYIIAFVPIAFTALIYIFIQLHDKNCKLIVCLSYPLKRLTGISEDWNPKKRILTTFASFFLLLYTKIFFASLRFLLAVNLYNIEGNIVKNSAILLYDPAIRLFDSDHIIYAVLTFSVFFIFIISPTVFLALYPTRFFRKLINLLGFRRWDVLSQIMDIFQGWYKDGSNGTRDYRIVASLYFLLRIGLWYVFIITFLTDFNKRAIETISFIGIGLTSVIFGVLLYVAKPYKITWMNHADGMTFTIAGVILILLPSADNKITAMIIMGLFLASIGFIPVYHKIYQINRCSCQY